MLNKPNDFLVQYREIKPITRDERLQAIKYVSDGLSICQTEERVGVSTFNVNKIVRELIHKESWRHRWKKKVAHIHIRIVRTKSLLWQ